MSSVQSYLLIDDNDAFASLLMRGFSRQGLELQWAQNGEEALEKHGPYEGIILDLNLGEESGLRLLPQLLEHYPETKILILTGYASISTAVNAIKMGASNYLPKPTNVDGILQAFEDQIPEQAISPETYEKPSLKRMTWEHIQYTLEANDGNISATARVLGMHRRTLQRMLSKRPVKK
ncbi:MAG: response regulator [Alcaligenaceae bacterium]|nr:response regulator [Alcaligenaceae bacterium]